MSNLDSSSAALPDGQVLYARLRDAVRDILAELRDEPVHLVGILSGGAWLAQQLQTDLALPGQTGALNISFYRDDFDRIGLHGQTQPSAIDFDVEGAHIILVDDVLYTGRTIRGAMNLLFDYGRPASIRLVVLADRGGRELPVQADFSAWTPQTPPTGSLVLVQDDNGQFQLCLEEEDTP